MDVFSTTEQIMMTTTTEKINDFFWNHSSTVDYSLNPIVTFCPETSSNCVIDHTKQCVGDPLYCNLTKEEYLELLYDYITPTVYIKNYFNVIEK